MNRALLIGAAVATALAAQAQAQAPRERGEAYGRGGFARPGAGSYAPYGRPELPGPGRFGRGYASPWSGPRFAPPHPAYGEWRAQQYEARQAVEHGRMAPLGRVLRDIGRRSPGRQLDAGLEYRDGRPVYRVLWMTKSGRRIDYVVDAASGRIIGGD